MLCFDLRRLSLLAALVFFAGSFVAGGSALAAPPFETTARNAILIDVDSGMVLYEKEADAQIHPASMSKLMTAYVVFEQLANGSLKLTDTIPVSVDTWRKWRRLDGSTMFLNAGDRPTVEELLLGVIVQSGNDACDVLAQAVGGTEENFAEYMNQKGKEIGLTASHFTNASGWPDPDHLMSVRDIATVGEHIIRDFSDYYHFYSVREFSYAGVKQRNRNPLLGLMDGADGLKTGYTDDAGYGVAVSAVREGQRLIGVVAGLKTSRERAREAERLLSHGFRNFKSYKLFDKGQMVEEASVWLGEHDRVPLMIGDEVKVTLDRSARPGMKATLVYDGPIAAPIEEGQQLGRIVIDIPNRDAIEVPVLAGASIAEITGFARVGATFKQLLWGTAQNLKPAPEAEAKVQ